MRVAVVGASGALGSSVLPALCGAGHEVVALARTESAAARIHPSGASICSGDIFDADSLATAFQGCDAVVNLATRIPTGYAAALPWAWRTNTRIRTVGAANVVAAARSAGVRRLVQESVSFVYADQGDQWITERDPLDITESVEPVAVAESHVSDFDGGVRTGVVLRFGQVIGDDDNTRFALRSARKGLPVGWGDPDSWMHVVHLDDVGGAVESALSAGSGTYNVGAAPVRRRDYVDSLASAAGAESGSFYGPVMRLLVGQRSEPLGRSLRVCSERFSAQTGWAPMRAELAVDWFSGLPVVDGASARAAVH